MPSVIDSISDQVMPWFSAARITLTPRPRSQGASVGFERLRRTKLADAASEPVAEDRQGRVARCDAAERVTLHAGLDQIEGRDEPGIVSCA